MIRAPVDITVIRAVSAPEKKHVGVLAALDNLWRSLRDGTGEDISQIGRGEPADLVVVDDIRMQVLPIGGHMHHSWIGVLRVVRQIILGDEHDMFIIVPCVAQHTVDIQRIRLMAVVVPTGAGSHHHGVPVLQRGIGDRGFNVGEGHDQARSPGPHLVHARLLGVVTASEVLHQMVFAVEIAPKAIPTA